jgi:hypothetical protein
VDQHQPLGDQSEGLEASDIFDLPNEADPHVAAVARSRHSTI